VSRRGDVSLEWLREMADFKNPIPPRHTPFVRTRHLNNKKDGCFMCARKSGTTRHHIRRGQNPLGVYLCWRHHQIIHGIALHKHKTADIRMVMVLADAYGLYKEGEEGVIKKLLLTELEMRRMKNNIGDFFRKLKGRR